MMTVAGIGVVINGITAFLFMKGRKRTSTLKVLSCIWLQMQGFTWSCTCWIYYLLTGWFWVDPAISLVIVLVITIGTWGLLKDSFHLSIDAVPNGINLKEVGIYLKSIDGVIEFTTCISGNEYN